jgi:hypothetical protein
LGPRIGVTRPPSPHRATRAASGNAVGDRAVVTTAGDRTSERSYAVAGTFIDHLERFNGTVADYAAGIAAHVLRKWTDPRHRAWFARAMRATADVIEENLETRIALLELPRTTVRRLRARPT